MALACLMLLAQVGPWWYASRDGASYLSIARSLADGGPPTNLGREQLFFAPAYSVFIAPVFWISDRPFLLLSLLHAALGVALSFLSRRWFARLSCRDATWLAAACVVNASIGIVLRRTLSEALFMPGLVATALVLEQLRIASKTRLSMALLLGAAAALTALVMTRQAGMMLLPGFACAMAHSAWRRELPWKRALVSVVVIAIPVMGSIFLLSAYDRAAASGEARTYADYLRFDAASLAEQTVSGVRMRVSEIGRVVLPGMFKASADGDGVKLLNLALYAAVTAFAVKGWWRAVRETGDTLLCSTPFYLALYVMWPFDEGIRFMIPYAPVWFLGIYRALPDRAELRHRLAVAFFIAHGLVGVGYWLADDLPDALHDHVRWPEIQRLAEAIENEQELVGWTPPKTDRQRVMLQFALDRPVTDLVANPALADDMHWIITAKEESPSTGYTPRTEPEFFKLQQRQE
jgi:hypothetical protein